MAEFNRNEGISGAIPPTDAVATALRRQVEVWTNTQSELLTGVEALWTDWMKRQREAIEASARSLQQMFQCRNLADLAQLQQHWMADTVRRTTADIGSLASNATALTCRLGGAEQFEFRPGDQSLAPRARRSDTGDGGQLQREAAE